MFSYSHYPAQPHPIIGKYPAPGLAEHPPPQVMLDLFLLLMVAIASRKIARMQDLKKQIPVLKQPLQSHYANISAIVCTTQRQRYLCMECTLDYHSYNLVLVSPVCLVGYLYLVFDSCCHHWTLHYYMLLKELNTTPRQITLKLCLEKVMGLLLVETAEVKLNISNLMCKQGYKYTSAINIPKFILFFTFKNVYTVGCLS